MSKARSGFITNFFGCAGYQIIGNELFRNLKDGIESAAKSQASIVAICSSDEEYPVIAPDIATEIKSKSPDTIVIVAGYPQESIEMLRNAGVDDFIHIRSNVIDTLIKYNQQLLK